MRDYILQKMINVQLEDMMWMGEKKNRKKRTKQKPF